MRADRRGIRDEVHRNRNGGRPRAYARTGNTDDERDANGDEDKKHNCERNLQGVSENKTGHTMGRKSMDERILREHGRTVCEQGDDSQIHTESREESKGLREDTRPTAGA